MKNHILAAICLGAVVAPSMVQARDLRIENRRSVALTELTITPKDNADRQGFVLAKDIAPGSVATRNVPRKTCLFDVKGVFEDQSTLAADDMDLCAQKTIRLVN